MIKLNNITYGYKGDETLFCDLSINFSRGNIHGLLGANGAGKTTLLKMVCGMISPQKGTLSINGIDPFEHRPSLLRELFFVPEEFSLPSISFDRFVKSYSEFYPNFSTEAMNYYVDSFEISKIKRLDKTSMGQLKKVLISFALACNTNLLIMDEPTNGLDIRSKQTYRHLIAGYADKNKTVIISTHQTQDIESLIDSIAFIDTKGVLINNSIEEVTRKLYFGPSPHQATPLYQEETIRGIYGVYENTNLGESKINLEALFNAGHTNRDKVYEIINCKI